MHQNRASIAYMGAASSAHKAHDSSSDSSGSDGSSDSSGSECSEDDDDEDMLGTLCGTTVSSKGRGVKGGAESAGGKRGLGGTGAAATWVPHLPSRQGQGQGRGAAGAGPGAGGRQAARRLRRDTQLRMLFRYSPDTLDEVLEAVAHGEVGAAGGAPAGSCTLPWTGVPMTRVVGT